ncbi:MAG: DUF4118 domain-containing protein [Chloracidobacterium sp.]|nr:DUF4118 domain-containing protein [Chloracidobacterium sp.]
MISVLLALAARFILEPVLGALATLVLFTMAVTVTAWYGGLGPGLMATLASGLLGDYLFYHVSYPHITSRNRWNNIFSMLPESRYH